MFASPGEALKYIRNNEIAMIDLKVVGISGRWLHLSIPAASFGEHHFADGIGYDGSSGAGFGTVEDGDVVALPIPDTAFEDPFWEKPTLSFICRTVSADDKTPVIADPRTVAERAVAYLRSTGVADDALMAPEFEFYVFDGVKVINNAFESTVCVNAVAESDRLSPPIEPRGGYLAAPPADMLHDLRSEVSLLLQQMQVPVRYHHHEVGSAGQCEIETELASLVTAADRAMLIKYVVKNVARRRAKLATFMPKPIFGEPGNGMHVHQKLDKGGRPLFYDRKEKNYANLSDLALHYIGGLLKHGEALTAITNPSTNSYKRLVPGLEAPVNLFFSLANRSAAIRVPRYAVSPEEKRIEYRPPDFSGNAYLSCAAMLLAGLDGINSKIDTTTEDFGPFDVDVAKEDAAFLERIRPLPRTLYDAVDALAADHRFLTGAEVFPKPLIDQWIAVKREEETERLAVRPHPCEYESYLDV